MSNRLPLSVFIIAKNEADRIARTIQSVKDWVREVIVVDSGSEDDTVEVAKSLGAKTFFRVWTGYGEQKRFGEDQCQSEWLLNLDADEEISPELAEEIRALFAAGDPIAFAYELKILTLSRFQKRLPMFAAGTKQIRLYHRSHGRFSDSPVHDTVRLNPGVGVRTLRHPVIHRSIRSFAHYVEKINSYTSMQAQDLFARGKNPGLFRILLTPPAAFLKCYFMKRYIFYGLDGFIQSCIYSFGRTLRLAKTRELFQEREFKAGERRHRASSPVGIEIIPYEDRYQKDFERLNVEWLQKYFYVEPEDKIALADPRKSVLDPGGEIVLARIGGEIIGCCALLKHADGSLELAKMAVTEKLQGGGVGRKLAEAVIERARQRGVRTLYIVTNSSLAPALALYKSLGFKESSLNKHSRYARGDLTLELPLNHTQAA